MGDGFAVGEESPPRLLQNEMILMMIGEMEEVAVLKHPTDRVFKMTGEVLPPKPVPVVLVDGMITTSQLQEANLGIRAVEGEEEATVVEEAGEEETAVMIVVAMIVVAVGGAEEIGISLQFKLQSRERRQLI